jgi:hypothetical protein
MYSASSSPRSSFVVDERECRELVTTETRRLTHNTHTHTVTHARYLHNKHCRGYKSSSRADTVQAELEDLQQK